MGLMSISRNWCSPRPLRLCDSAVETIPSRFQAPVRSAGADAGEMLEAVEHDLAAEAVALDVEQAGGVGLVAAGDFQDAGDEQALGVGEPRDRVGFERWRSRIGCRRRSIVAASRISLGKWATSIVRSPQNKNARSIALRSSRTLPGQS